jgi:hypothetical protein
MKPAARRTRALKVQKVASALVFLTDVLDGDHHPREWQQLAPQEKDSAIALAHGLVALWKALNEGES